MGYKALTSALDRQINKQVNWGEYKDLGTIGIDEISMKKGYKSYVTIVSSRNKENELSLNAVLGEIQRNCREFLTIYTIASKENSKGGLH